MPEIIYDRTFCSDSGGDEARAVIVDYSDRDQVEFRFGIEERGSVTYKEVVAESCVSVPKEVRRSIWLDLFQRARDALDREIRIATDPHYDLPDREIY